MMVTFAGNLPENTCSLVNCQFAMAFSPLKGYIPSGKRLQNYGKSPFSMGNSTINGPFSIANC